ncbi:MAG: glucan biosynthesis protein G [Xanthobacteraceae bacterium]|nr:glucan biosynthesis protein G [Xanthobacteraceae bacterium]
MGGLSLPLAAALARGGARAQPAGEWMPFAAPSVREMARELASKPFRAPNWELPQAFRELGYDAYRGIRFVPDRALWRGDNLPFQVQLFHRGFIFTDRVDIHEVVQGRARLIRYAPDLFTFNEGLPQPQPNANLGFAGFRLHAPINRGDYHDEIGTFLGASYFRAVGKGQVFGLSARGLSLKTGDPKGEEFPAFRAFWIERPQPQTNSIVVHALLDSQSAAAAYRFTIRPGEATVYDVEMGIYPRVAIDQAGIGTLTSMFWFGPGDRNNADDFRPAVHDSDGLAIRNGRGEQLWRPLANPQDLQISAFADTNPRGFGLLQRRREFAAYQDLEAQYQKRPSAWVEPIGDWGEGQILLVEIPTRNEYNDNIVAFWRPKEPFQPKRDYTFVYRLHWGREAMLSAELAAFTQMRVGAAGESERQFVLETTGEMFKSLPADAEVIGKVTADKGQIRHVVTQPNPHTGGWRLSFRLAPERAPLVELRAQLLHQDKPVSEVWVHRWTP